ncbi:MAG: hypothetical protein LUH40_00300, partial [Clostridiales bacterium]|nr:hypothetical protein [Clostridiales bacterium]
MQSASKNGKRALAVLLSVLMVFSVWGGVIVPTVADAAGAGNYYISITYYWNDNRGDTLDSEYGGWSTVTSENAEKTAGISVIYYDDNGTDTTKAKEVYWDLGKTGDVNGDYVTAEGTDYIIKDADEGEEYSQTLTATISGFPTMVGLAGHNRYYLNGFGITVTKIEIGSSSSNLTTVWDGEMQVNSTTSLYYGYVGLDDDGNFTSYVNDSSGISSLTKTGVKITTNSSENWTMPEETTVKWSSTAAKSVDVPTSSTSNTVSTQTATIYDQYGVTWNQAPYYAISASAATTTSSASITGVTRKTGRADTGTITVSNSAKDWVLAGTYKSYRYVYVTAYANSSVYTTSYTRIIITNYTVTADFVDYDDTPLGSSTVYYGYAATAPSDPERASDETYHYTFSDWDTDISSVKADVTVKAVYTPEEHSFDTYEVTTPATCTTAGTGKYTCSACGYSYEEEIPATGHLNTSTINAKDATCTEDGYTGDTYCSDCKQTIATGSVIPATGHTEYISKAAQAATCTEAGWTAEISCSVCNKVITESTVIPATGHSEYTSKAAQAATCTEDGWTAEISCSVCNKVITESTVIPATGHSEYTSKAAQAATCTEAGWT